MIFVGPALEVRCSEKTSPLLYQDGNYARGRSLVSTGPAA